MQKIIWFCVNLRQLSFAIEKILYTDPFWKITFLRVFRVVQSESALSRTGFFPHHHTSISLRKMEVKRRNRNTRSINIIRRIVLPNISRLRRRVAKVSSWSSTAFATGFTVFRDTNIWDNVFSVISLFVVCFSALLKVFGAITNKNVNFVQQLCTIFGPVTRTLRNRFPHNLFS